MPAGNLAMLANEVAWIAGVVRGIARRGLKLDSTSQDPSLPHLPPRHERACPSRKVLPMSLLHRMRQLLWFDLFHPGCIFK